METKNLFGALEDYRVKNSITNSEISRELCVPETYIYRWRKKGVSGVYARIVKDYLEKVLK